MTAYHPELGAFSYELFPLPDDPDQQVAHTIDRMRRNVLQDARSPEIQNEAAALRGSVDPLSDSFWYVKNKVGFRQDEELSAPVSRFLDGPIVEVLVRPRDMAGMQQPLEDCDGSASYLSALLKAQGVSCSFVTVAADAREPGRFSHVYAACTDPKTGQRVSLDASHGPYPGWECTETGRVTRFKEWPIDGPDWSSLILIAAVLFAAAKVWGLL